ncbi:hypothetical protein P171DRAFT_474887 [Karstenula rhodostoma CBS 690.94]|uniref:Uncharacterized protein n=1 Tax=Karstenula rhodostoma CBS 690.94 TaxID=1392251 RepID=A0A9P4U8Q5_9PLEO|nr:hypothetical protein P171DRAFT_474887 [Karstenula rhodostoma CBS 690.94]
MRFSTSAIFAAVAIGAQALPQDVQPITQISDGQIQAPPATAPAGSYEVPTAPAPTEVLPSVTPVPLPSVVPSSAPAPVEPSSAYNTPVAPSVPAGTGVTSAPYPISSGAVYTNGTVAPTGASTSAPAGETSGSPQPTEGPGSGAATTFVSMGALFAGLFAFLA